VKRAEDKRVSRLFGYVHGVVIVVCKSYFWKTEFLKAESKGGESYE